MVVRKESRLLITIKEVSNKKEYKIIIILVKDIQDKNLWILLIWPTNVDAC